MWFRVDNRLVHGQIIETWVPYINASLLLVVNDALAADALQQMVVSLAVPDRIHVEFIKVAQAPARCAAAESAGTDTLVLFADCTDVRRAMGSGLAIRSLNIGNLHFSPGKRQLCSHISLSSHDQTCLDFFREHQVSLDFRCVPGVPVTLQEWT